MGITSPFETDLLIGKFGTHFMFITYDTEYQEKRNQLIEAIVLYIGFVINEFMEKGLEVIESE